MSRKFIVLKGRNLTPGTASCSYVIFDAIEFDCPPEKLENEQRKYAFRKLFETDYKPAYALKGNVFCRRRHILLGNDDIFAEKVKVFDHEPSGIYYAFVPKEVFDF